MWVDVLRWIVITGTIVFLTYEVVGLVTERRVVVPTTVARMLFAIIVLTDQGVRLGEPVTWRLPVAAFAVTLGICGGIIAEWVINRDRDSR